MLRRLLVWLGLKCPCGGWRTVFKRYEVHVADVTLDDGTVEPVNLAMRPCKKCGLATSKPKTLKLRKKELGVITHSEIRTYYDPDEGVFSRER
jgi:hypothetical protein